MTTPIGGTAPENIGGAGGTILGGNLLQTSVDTLTTAVNALASRIGSLSFNNAPTNAQTGQGGGPTRTFPGMINPFSNNTNQPGIGGGGPGGTGNIPPINPFGMGGVYGRSSALGAFTGSFAGYGQQQLPIQLALNAYATQTAMAQGQVSPNFTAQYRQAFGFQGQNLNFMASSPLDALAGTQGLQYLAGNPTFMGTPIGRSGFGFAAGFSNANPLASMQQSVGFAQQMMNPQMSLMMMAMGYPVTPRRLGGGANLPGNVVQGMLRAWYGQKSVNPSTLTAGLGQGGRANLNLMALGINPQQAQPLFTEYNDLFNAGLSPAQAQALINQSKSGNAATAKAAQVRLGKLGVPTAVSSAQAMRNNQAVITSRDANIASGFARGLQDATGILTQFNTALNNIMTTLNLNGAFGWAGGFGGILAGTNHGNPLMGIGGGLSLGMLGARLLGFGGAGGGAGGLGGVAGGLGGGGAAAFAGAAGLGTAAFFAQNWVGNALTRNNPTARSMGRQVSNLPGNTTPTGINEIISWLVNSFSGGSNTVTATPHFAAGGLARDTIPAMLSPGEAVLNPGATRAMGPWNIHNLNNRYRPAGATTSYNNGILRAAGGYSNPFRRVSNLTPERVDMGVDYSGSGPVYAIGPGVVSNLYNSGWPGGTFLSYKFTGGADQGKYVYVAEGIKPRVRVGQRVDSNTIIGNMSGGIETGWAAPPGTGNALGASQFSGSNSTAYGVNFNNLLKSLGAPGGIINGNPTGTVPSSWGGSSSSSSTSTAPGMMMGGASGVGFSEASMIPAFSEVSALSGGMATSATSTIGTGSPMGVSKGSGGTGTSNAPGGTPAKNMAIGKQLAAKFGWATGVNWDSLVKLWTGESGWRNTAMNPGSHAYGIPQALPYTKMPKEAWPPSAGGQANAGVQETWGMDYIKGRYHDPANAYKQWLSRSPHWYGEGGSGSGMAIVGDRGPEVVDLGAGGSVMSGSRTANLLRGISARPASSPWINVSDVNASKLSGGGGSQVHLHFNKDSVVIRVDHAGSDASSSGRHIAKQFIKWLADEEMYTAIGSGNKNG